MGLRGPETAAPSSAGDRPGAGGGAGARERGRPGPGAARPPAAPRAARAALPGVRILGDGAAPRSPLVSPRGPRGRDRSLCRGWLRRGAGQLRLQGGPRQDHGGRIAAEGGGGGRAALGTRRRRQRRSLLLLLLPPPPPPAWEWEGASRDWLSMRAGVAAAAFDSSSSAPASDQLASPAHPPRAHTPSSPYGRAASRTTGPAHSSPSGGGGRGTGNRAERRMRAPRATSRRTGGRRGSRRGGGYRPEGRAGGSCLGGGRAGRPLRDRAAEGGLGQKVHDRTHVLGSLRREALTPVAPPLFCNRRKPCPVFAGERGWERVLMNGKSKKRGGDAVIPDHARRRTLLVPLCIPYFK